MKEFRGWILTVMFALSAVVAVPARATDLADVEATVTKWIADFNKGDMKSFVAACAPHAAIVDGFPPYAWQTEYHARTACPQWELPLMRRRPAIQPLKELKERN